jgi:hydrogenase nickel incorporation protein HypA/HybF
MHELAVTQNILEIALRHAEAGQHITDLYIVIGDLSSMIDDSVQFYWDIISQNTPAQGAALHFRRIPAEMLCSNCNQRYALEGDQFACPACGGTHATLVAGEEFYLDSIEVQSTAEVAL